MVNEFTVMLHNGRQYIPDLRNVNLKTPFRGRPEISTVKVDEQALVDICPLNAISANPVRIDMGKCSFCAECAFAFPEKIRFTQDYLTSSNVRENLIIKEGENNPKIGRAHV